MASSYFVIVCNSADNTLGLYDLDHSGRLAHLRDLPLAEVGAAGSGYPMATSNDRKRLYVAYRGVAPAVLAYAVDAEKRELTYLGKNPLADNMAYITTDSSGRFLLSASYSGGKVSVNPIAPDGIANGFSDTVDALPNMHCCIPVPGTDTFLATSLGSDLILKFRVDPAGKLTWLPERSSSAQGSGPRHFVFHPSLRFGYLLTEKTSSVDVFAFDGEMLAAEPMQTLSILPPNWRGGCWAADIRITPDGRFLYASDRNASSVTVFALNPETGRLSIVEHVFLAPRPRAFNLTPDGKFLVAPGEASAVIDVFAIDASTGRLDKRHALATGQFPSWVEVVAA